MRKIKWKYNLKGERRFIKCVKGELVHVFPPWQEIALNPCAFQLPLFTFKLAGVKYARYYTLCNFNEVF